MSDNVNNKTDPKSSPEKDDADLEQISVIVEPDLPAGEFETPRGEQESGDTLEITISVETEISEKTKDDKEKLEPLNIATANVAKKQESGDIESVPSVIIQDDIIAESSKESENTSQTIQPDVVLGFVKIIGSSTDESIEKIQSPAKPFPDQLSVKSSETNQISPTTANGQAEEKSIPAEKFSPEESKEIPEWKVDLLIKQAIKEVEDITKTGESIEKESDTVIVKPSPAEISDEAIRQPAGTETVESIEIEPIEKLEDIQPPQQPETPKISEIIKPSPPPPPLKTRPSKQPPKPPRRARPDAVPSSPGTEIPPPPPKGLSMKSIVDHLPAIISIPDDEVPRLEQEAKQQAGTSAIPSAEIVTKPKKKWFEEIFNEDYIRLMPATTELHRKREINFLQKTLGLAPGSVILDIACGTGTQCIGMYEKGYQMVGLDLSFAMLAIASEEAQARNCKINFIQKDMREMDFKDAFDGAYCIGSSFGYFDDEDNEKVIENVYRALKPGGVFLLEVDNRDYVLRQTPGLLWFEGDGVVCMEETQFDFITSRLRVKRTLLFEDGSKKMHTYSLRLYSIHELGRMLHRNGFRVDSAGGHRATPSTFVGEDSAKIIILAQKRLPNEK